MHGLYVVFVVDICRTGVIERVGFLEDVLSFVHSGSYSWSSMVRIQLEIEIHAVPQPKSGVCVY